MRDRDFIAQCIVCLMSIGLTVRCVFFASEVDKLKAENIKLRLNQMPLREPNGKFKKNA
jgi:hypothetical protein